MKTGRFLHGLFWALVFGLFAYWQFNDPDPALWVSIYAVALGLSLFHAVSGKRRWIHLLAAVLAVAGAIYWWPGRYEGLTLENGYTPGIEEARESLGLAIVAFSNFLFLGLFRRSK